MKRGAWITSAARGNGEYKFTHTRKSIVNTIQTVLKNTTPTRLRNHHRDKETLKGALAQLIYLEGIPLRLGNELDSEELETIQDFYREFKAAIQVRVTELKDANQETLREWNKRVSLERERWESVGPKTYQSVPAGGFKKMVNTVHTNVRGTRK